MAKVAKKHASGGQEINPLDPKCVTVKACLATPSLIK